MTDFFEADTVYTDREHEYKAPEMVFNFWARHVEEIPGTGLMIAFGYARRENEPEWTPTGMSDKHWAERAWKVKERLAPGGVPRETKE